MKLRSIHILMFASLLMLLSSLSCSSDSDNPTGNNPPNEAPVVTDIPDQTIAEGAIFATIGLNGYVADADHLDNEMTWAYSSNDELTVNIDGSNVVTVTTPDPNWSGAETITFRATDPGNLFSENSATFTVTGGNEAPVVTDIPDQTIAEGATFATIGLNGYVADADHLDNEITWTYSGNIELTVNIDGSNVVTVTAPDPNWSGAETITFRATDPGNLFSEDSATFTVTAAPAIYVSQSTGDNDLGDGSKSKPFKSLNKAYSTPGVKLIKMEAGSYTDDQYYPFLYDGIDVEGGYAVPAWTRGSNNFTVFNIGQTTLEASYITSHTVISQIEILTSGSSSANSIAMNSINSTDSLVFNNCRFIATNAANGSRGVDGNPGFNGASGKVGGNGSCSGDFGRGGAGGSLGAIWGNHGGAGGDGGSQDGPFNGAPGDSSTLFDGRQSPGGAGGNDGFVGGGGSGGIPGIRGARGIAGPPASPEGSTDSMKWSPLTSGNGTFGNHGSGGGGGGGGGAQNCAVCNNGGGNGGGGGGSGGGVGGYGTGGSGGWGSLSVQLVSSSPTFIDCYFQSGNGGKGGRGGDAGIGGAGGIGGEGGQACTDEVGPGGRGGDGGPGGGSGAGAGGPGGPSYGVYKLLESSPTLVNAQFQIGLGGAGGLGGRMDWGFASDGASGLKGNTN